MKTSNKTKFAAILMLSAILAAGCTNSTTTSSTNSTETETAVETDTAVQSGQTEGTEAAGELGDLSIQDLVEYDSDDLTAEWNADGSTAINLSGSNASVTGEGVQVSGADITITSAGTYVIRGELTDGSIVIDAGEDDLVRLVLNGAKINSSDSPAVQVNTAGKTVVTLNQDTSNTLSDGTTYADTSEEAPTAALYSQQDLTINGTGQLTVKGNHKDGITSKDDLKIVSGTLNIEAADDGLVGRDLAAVKSAAVTVTAGGDAIKTTYDEDKDKGYLVVEDGEFDINAGRDGFQSSAALLIDGGNYKVVTGGGRENAVTSSTEEADQESMKGLKGEAGVSVSNGTFHIDSADDAVHSSGDIQIKGGELNLNTGDDGIHADKAVAISGGTVNIEKCEEGIEAADIHISGGEIKIKSSDDGLNASDGSSSEMPQPAPGQNTSSDLQITISGGHISIDAEGDGLDSNGNITMTGGTLLVNGATKGADSALDYDGTLDLSGGLIVTTGRGSGMAQYPSQSSTQPSVLMTFPSSVEAGTLITLTDKSGTPIISFTPTKNTRAFMVSSPNLKAGETYAFHTGGTSTGTAKDGMYEGGEISGSTEVVSFELGEDAVTYVNESGVTTGSSGGAQGKGGPGKNR